VFILLSQHFTSGYFEHDRSLFPANSTLLMYIGIPSIDSSKSTIISKGCGGPMKEKGNLCGMFELLDNELVSDGFAESC
jgi:hypothetical protein